MKKTVLCVEDGPDDVLLLRLALQGAKIDCQLEAVADVQTAKAYLTGQGRFTDRARYPAPALVLSDMALPGDSGLELLGWIRQTFSPEALPVVVMTGSEDQQQLHKARAAGANFCVPKTPTFHEVTQVVHSLLQ